MIKIFCDICGKEPNDPDFMCEMQVNEVKTGIDSRSFASQKHLDKKLIQICRVCYDEKIAPLFHGKKETGTAKKS